MTTQPSAVGSLLVSLGHSSLGWDEAGEGPVVERTLGNPAAQDEGWHAPTGSVSESVDLSL